MDPQATLCVIMEFLEAKDRDSAMTALENFYEWLDCGGFIPAVKRVHLGEDYGEYCGRTTYMVE